MKLALPQVWGLAQRMAGVGGSVFLFGVVVNAQTSRFASDAAGNLSAQTSETLALPQILGQPRNQVVIPGQAAAFSIVVADTRGVSYQWYFNAAAISAATADALVLTNVSTNNEGQYSVVVSNTFGPVPSSPAFLFIDSDGDGLPDSWEIAYFGNLNQTASGDRDGDGVSNAQEYFDGTSPTNAVSVLYRINLLNDGGTVVVAPNQPTYTNGQIVTLSAFGSNSAPFHAWTGDVTTRSNSIAVTVSNNLTLFAHFLPFTFQWTNAAGGDWNGATNWSPNLVPGSNENVIIITGVSVSLNNDVDLTDFTLGSDDSSSILTGTGNLTVHGTCLWPRGLMSGSGRTAIAPGGVLNLGSANTLFITGRTLENGGTAVWSGTGGISINGGAIINDTGGSLTFLNSVPFNYGGGSPRLDNYGMFTNYGTLIFSIVNFNNYNDVQIQGGTLQLNGGGLNNGTMEVPAGTTLVVGGNFTANPGSSITGAGNFTANATLATMAGLLNVTGTHTFSGGTAELNGNYICTNNTMVISGGVANFDGAGTVAPSTLNLSSGVLGGGSTVRATGVLNWAGGSMNGSGRTVVPAGGTFNLGSANTLFINGRTVENGGTAIWSGGGGITMNGGVITNDAGASLTIQNPINFNYGGGSPRVDNAGVFRTSSSPGTTFFSNTSLNNYNDVQIQGGTVQLNGGGSNKGTMEVPAGATLFVGGNFTAFAGSGITGAGNFTANANLATMSGLLNLAGTHTFSGGTAELNGNYFCTNNTMIISGGIANFDGTGTVAPATLNLSSGALAGVSTVTVSNVFNWTGGSMNGSGRTVVPAGGTLNLGSASTLFIAGRTVENGGTAVWSGTGGVSMNGGVITNDAGASLTLQSPITFGYGGGAPRVDNAGVLRTSSSAGATFFSNTSFNNYNDTQIQGGTLQLNGGGVNNGTIEVPAGATLVVGGNFTANPGSSITGAGNFTASATLATMAGLLNVTGTHTYSGGTAELSGNYICTNNIMVISGGTANFDGTGKVAPSTLNLSSGILAGVNTVTVAGVLNWTGGSMNGSGRTVIPAGGTCNLGGGTLFISDRTLENGGTATWTGNAGITTGNGVITNDVGGVFNVQNSASFNYGGGSPRFDNAGTFRKSVSTGTTSFFNTRFANYGTVDIQSGILAPNGGYVSSSEAILNCALWGTTAGATYGQLQVAGTVNLNGTLSVNLTNHYIPATNDTFTVLSAGTRSGTFANFIYPSNNVSMSLSNAASSEIVRVTGVSLQQTNPLSPAPGIISWWRAENDAKDAVGTNHGVLTNGATFAPGKVGQSFLLDGINGYVVIPDSPSLRPASVTLEAWVLFNATNGFRLIMGRPVGSGILDSFALWLSDGVLNGVICDIVSGGPVISYTMLPVLGQWYHLAYTYNGATLQQALYVNGAAVATGTGYQGAGYDAHPMLIGSDNDNGVQDGFFSGQIDEATVYNRALGANEIASIYNVGSAGKQLFSASQPVLHMEVIAPTSARLYWSTNYPDFHLEYNASLSTSNWAAWALPPVIQGTNYVATNSFFARQKYYRLSRLTAPYTPPPPSLAIERISSGDVRLLWPVEDERMFLLQSNTNLSSTNWAPVSPPPAILGGDNVVTNAISGTREFYRLSNP